MILFEVEKISPLAVKTPPSAAPRFAVVILAAGASRRMGSPKALLPWAGRTILEHLAATWAAAGACQIAVVYDPGNAAVTAELDRLEISQRIENQHPEAGMMSSARAAAAFFGQAMPLTHMAISLIDQPQISVDLIQQLAGFSATHPGCICQPEHAGKRGHPVFFPYADFLSLASAPEETLRDFIHRHAEQRRFLSWPGAEILHDLDTPEDYEKARRFTETD